MLGRGDIAINKLCNNEFSGQPVLKKCQTAKDFVSRKFRFQRNVHYERRDPHHCLDIDSIIDDSIANLKTANT